ncbi:MAG: hypothetical protein GY862_36135, partial [Gammaproteobacteria bacterium]|nr:hypothetical protein [Gammaproteobacteria bacterium]
SFLRFCARFFIVFISFAGASVLADPQREGAEILFAAHQEGRRIPVLSAQYPDMDIKAAYGVQKAYVAQRIAKDKKVGFKAALTSQKLQKRFKAAAPLAGVLFAGGKNTNGALISKSMFHDLRIETEIGFVAGKRIIQKLENINALQKHIRAVLPVIELPDLGFMDMKQLKGVDIVAANTASAQFIIGQEKPLRNPDALSVTLFRDGAAVNAGKGADVAGGQWNTALWLVNTMVEQGYAINPGDILISGALGKMLPGKPGKYLADYAEFGQISFEIRK